MGLDRADEFAGVEPEDCDLLIAIDFDPQSDNSSAEPKTPSPWEPQATHWMGRANLLDPHPIYRWPVIDQVSLATQGAVVENPAEVPNYAPLQSGPTKPQAAEVILNRRSAQRFDSKFTMSADAFYRMVDCLLVRPLAPWDVWTYRPRRSSGFLCSPGGGPGTRPLCAAPPSRRCALFCKKRSARTSSGRNLTAPRITFRSSNSWPRIAETSPKR